MSEAYAIIGAPRFGGILVVSDHASNRVPDDIDLGIDAALLNQHVAIDIGVAEVGALMAQQAGIAAFQGGISRLVCDFNRDENLPTVVPIASDGHAIPGNALDHAGHQARLARFFRPYHEALAALLAETPQALILSLHSFTPQLASSSEKRPWHVGVLYNEDDRAARIAIPLLEAEGLCVGNQQPYSGKLLNATMNRHAEADGRPYLGIEVRQDLIGDAAGQAEWAARLAKIANVVAVEIS
ncbi:N-formylglutamate amidohydrolase [Novosphingobium sp. ERN07]|uniref:N-formylglutamate amidohydrolase n=1 Tax=Novosphingobium sp. ERN07 TaxID=2726187 RepID=UPI001456AD16|nr:N-formylglutamate amidohydrolase [Novosphingobium sp. ERN07]NLR72928.1 N-formylglutamate amidohydrolase [Novosphingobium sp. ERN07]